MSEARITLTAADATGPAFASVRRSLSGLVSQAEATRQSLSGIGQAIASAVSVGAIAAAIKSTADYADGLGKMAQRVGMSTEELSRLSHAARLADVSSEALTSGMRAFNKEVATGGEKLALMGIATRDASGNARNTADIIGDVADVFAGMADGAEKAALAQALFGRSGAELIPLLNAGRDGLREAGAEAERFGIVVSDRAAKAAEQFNDNLTRLGALSRGAAREIAGPLVEALGSAISAMLRAHEEGGRLAGVIAGLQQIITGDDRYKAERDIVRQTERLLDLQGQLDKERAGPSRRLVVAELQREIDASNEKLRLARQYIQMLDLEAERKKALAEATRQEQVKAGEKTRANIAAILGEKGQGGEKRGEKRDEFADILARINARSDGLDPGFYKSLLVLKSGLDAGRISLDEYIATVSRYIDQQPYRVRQIEDEARARVAAAAITDKQVAAMVQQNEQLLAGNQSLADQVQEIGLAADKLALLRQARVDDAIAQQQQLLIAAQNAGASAQEIAQIERRIELLRQQRTLLGKQELARIGGERDAEIKGLTDSVYSSTRDGLARALREGKNPVKAFASSLGDSVLNAMTQSISTALLNALGFGPNGIVTGFFSSLFGSLLGFKFADGGIMTPSGPVPLRKYAAGGIANSPQLALYGEGRMPEAYVPLPDGRRIPVAMSGGAGGVTVHQHFTVGDVASISMVRAAVAGSEARIAMALQRQRIYGAEAA